jgi:hypothetical protein
MVIFRSYGNKNAKPQTQDFILVWFPLSYLQLVAILKSLRQEAAIRLIFFGDGKDKKNKPKDSILFQTVWKRQPDEDKVAEMKQ